MYGMWEKILAKGCGFCARAKKSKNEINGVEKYFTDLFTLWQDI